MTATTPVPASLSRQHASGDSTRPLLEVRHLATEIQSRQRRLRAVDDVSFQVERGEILGRAAHYVEQRLISSIARVSR